MPSNFSVQAGGAIAPARFIKLDTAADFQVVQCSVAAERTLGVSIDAQAAPPIPGASTNAAAAGDSLRFFGPGEECLIELGAGGCVRGDLLKTDASGKAVSGVIAGQFYGGEALESGAAGEKVRIIVRQATA